MSGGGPVGRGRRSALDVERERRELAARLVDTTSDAVVCSDADGRILLWNDAAAIMFGYPAEQAIGHSLDLIVPEAMRGEHVSGMRRLLDGGDPRLIGVPVDVPAAHSDGRPLRIEMRLAMWSSADGPIFGAIIRDVSARRLAEDRLHSLAHFDQLTMLPNRILFLERLGVALGPEDRPRTAALLLVDLDRFAEVDDIEGHGVGDDVLRETALRLRRKLIHAGGDPDAAATVARMGGNQFGVLIPGDMDLLEAAELAESLRAGLSKPVVAAGRRIRVAASIGIALAPVHGTTSLKLLANADFALRRAKLDGGDRFQLFRWSDREAAVAHRILEAELRRAWEACEFEVFYQPQVRLADRRLIGAEALLRWRHPERGLVRPGEFIAALEGSPIAGKVGEWVLNTACAQAASWRGRYTGSFRVAVNLFKAQFAHRDLPARVRAALDRSGLPAEDLEIEITENVVIGSDDVFVDRVRRLKELGVSVAFDDYGTGYASLSLLKRFPIDRLKIDSSFVRELSSGTDEEAIVEMILALGERFALVVIAEGVETAEQEIHLRRLGCHEAQGYLFGRPMSAADFEQAMIAPDSRFKVA
jgi:diguanylate cyclase (GGDEF)-like protein/PAS domain S-box-containing protein